MWAGVPPGGGGGVAVAVVVVDSPVDSPLLVVVVVVVVVVVLLRFVSGCHQLRLGRRVRTYKHRVCGELVLLHR